MWLALSSVLLWVLVCRSSVKRVEIKQVLVKQVPGKKLNSKVITQTPVCLGRCTFPSWPVIEVAGRHDRTVESCRRSSSSSHGLLLEPYTLSPVWPHDPWWGVGRESCNEGERAFLAAAVAVCGFRCEASAGPAWWGGPRWGHRRWVRWWLQLETKPPWRKGFPADVRSHDGRLQFDVVVFHEFYFWILDPAGLCSCTYPHGNTEEWKIHERYHRSTLDGTFSQSSAEGRNTREIRETWCSEGLRCGWSRHSAPICTCNRWPHSVEHHSNTVFLL